MSEKWIPVTERLPENLDEVIITWVNTNPLSYYKSIKDVPFTGVAVFYNEDWYWYSSITHGMCENMLIDDAIKITAWMPLPEPYREENNE